MPPFKSDAEVGEADKDDEDGPSKYPFEFGGTSVRAAPQISDVAPIYQKTGRPGDKSFNSTFSSMRDKMIKLIENVPAIVVMSLSRLGHFIFMFLKNLKK